MNFQLTVEQPIIPPFENSIQKVGLFFASFFKGNTRQIEPEGIASSFEENIKILADKIRDFCTEEQLICIDFQNEKIRFFEPENATIQNIYYINENYKDIVFLTDEELVKLEDKILLWSSHT